MSLIQVNRNPSARDLRWFGAIVLVVFGVIGMVIRTAGLPEVAFGVWAFGALGTLVYYALAPLRIPFYRAWMWAVQPLGFVLSHVLLGTIYFAVLTPLALVLRLFGRDALALRIDPEAQSYLTRVAPADDVERYFRQS